MKRADIRKTPERKRKSGVKGKKKSSNRKGNGGVKIFLWIFILLLSAGFLYFKRNAVLHYFSFRTNKKVVYSKIEKQRIFHVLQKHKENVVGIDVSQYQGKIEWEKVKHLNSEEEKYPVQYVFIRATAGINKTDKRFHENWEASGKAGLIRGAYHYYRPHENSTEQAMNFIKNVKLSKGDLPPVLDIEQLPKNQSMENLKKGLNNWISIIDSHYKTKPIIYSGDKYYENYLKKEFKGYTLWIANYNSNVNTFKKDWAFWQFTEKAIVDGIPNKVDVNIYNGTPGMLKYLTISN